MKNVILTNHIKKKKKEELKLFFIYPSKIGSMA